MSTRIVAILSALALVLGTLAPAGAASGRQGGGGAHHGGGGHGGGHGHGRSHHRGCCWGGFYAFPFFYPYGYPYDPYAYFYPYPAYVYPDPVYAPPVVAEPIASPPPQGQPTLSIQREVVYPHGKYVLYGAVVGGIERDPAVRGRPELDPGVALRGLGAPAVHVQVAAHVAARDPAQP